MMKNFREELEGNILSFWIDKMQDRENGGFYGCMDGYNNLQHKANKGAILNARILWTFSAAYRITKKTEYLQMATRAFDYITQYFIDKKHGGVFWELNYKGEPTNTKKQTYAQGFALYGFSEYYRATNDTRALELSKDFFYLIEKHKDEKCDGYFEAFTQDWMPIDDMRLSDKDANEKKTMNTHLHILEPYTNLCRIWNNTQLKDAQRSLISIFTEKILDQSTYHLNLFFDENWIVKSTAVSYGHGIEAAWLLFEAAEILNDSDLTEKIKSLSLKIANAASEGLIVDGSMIYEKEGSHVDKECHWWVQAEAIVGYMYAYKNSGNSAYKEKAEKLWIYIQNNLVDKTDGEWYWSRLEDGNVNTKEDKAGFWKCPYHNGRMCMEMIENFELE